MSNDLAKLINGPADEKIVSKVGDQNNRSPTKSRNPKTHKCQNNPINVLGTDVPKDSPDLTN
ncbi:10304_t:CDS:2 [Rhizophagus irregularis]|nr:10304_t:CDS:2 [Rhizophagus irregularis]